MALIGTSIKRVEDRRLLTGAGRFVGDLRRAGMVHAAVVRSPHAHARIARIDTRAARAHPGVVDSVTFADLTPPVGVIPIRMAGRPELDRYLQRPLASGTVRYVGEPIAIVIAEDAYVAEDARDLVEIDYEPLPVVVDALDAMRPGAPALHGDGTPLSGGMALRSFWISVTR